jgi:hypothetical protein
MSEFLKRLDRCIDTVEAVHRRQNAAAIREYCRQTERLLAFLESLMVRADCAPDSGQALHVHIMSRWVRRVVAGLC